MCLLSTHVNDVMIVAHLSVYHLMKTYHLKLSTRTKVLSPEQTKAISGAVQLASLYEVAETAMRISSLRNAIKNVFLKEVDKQCSQPMCQKKCSAFSSSCPKGTSQISGGISLE